MKKTPKHSRGMLDISRKKITRRTARARAKVRFTSRAFNIFLKQGSPKGDVFATAQTAAVMAAKSTPQIIPMCHPLSLSKVEVHFSIDKKHRVLVIESEVFCRGQTGVEMEALISVTVAALTVYDMMKFADKGIEICDIHLLKKTGGKSGDYKR